MRSNRLADALRKFLKARGLSDEQATEVLAEVITSSPGYSGKWSAGPPDVTGDTRKQLVERLRSSETLRAVISRLGHDPDVMAADVRKRADNDKRGS